MQADEDFEVQQREFEDVENYRVSSGDCEKAQSFQGKDGIQLVQGEKGEWKKQVGKSLANLVVDYHALSLIHFKFI